MKEPTTMSVAELIGRIGGKKDYHLRASREEAAATLLYEALLRVTYGKRYEGEEGDLYQKARTLAFALGEIFHE